MRCQGKRPPLPCAGYMENYTVPFLVVSAVLCYLLLLILWVIFGLPFTLIAAFIVDRFIPRP